jgi:hypothetical protein
MSLPSSEKLARLQKALHYGGDTHSLSDLIGVLHSGEAKLIENPDAVIIAEMHRFPQFSAVHFWLIAGVLRECLALEDEVLAWGVENGATVATACGRRGWGRVAAATGWREWHPNFIRPITQVSP